MLRFKSALSVLMSICVVMQLAVVSYAIPQNTVFVEDSNEVVFETSESQKADLYQEVQYSMTISASANAITVDGGSVTITPNVVADDENIVKTVSYATSNSNVQATKNADGTLTLVGKNNGEVIVTAYSDYDKSITDSITISVSGQIPKKAYYDMNVFMLGNSIIKHAYAPQTGWDGSGYGMAATKKENDYVHRLMQHYMVEKYGELDFTAFNYSQFERDIKNELNVDYESSGFRGLALVEAQMQALSSPPEIVTIQGGENATSAVSPEAFKEAYLQLFEVIKRNSAPNVQIVLTTVFWPQDSKIQGIHAAAKEAGVRCADIYVLGSDDENKAYDDYKGACNGHPGDVGMDRIAQMIYKELNVTLTENIQPTEYVYIPETIEITASKAEITQNEGTLNLSVNAVPSNAGNAVKWSVDNENIATVDTNGVLTAKNNGTVTVTAVSRFDKNVTDTFTVAINGQTLCYTVTYSAGGVEGVTALPQSFDYAKGSYTLSMSAPKRDYYIFEGWTLEDGGNTLVQNVDVTSDTTVYASWRPADSWDFNIDGYTEEITALNGFNVQVQNSAMLAYATETNLETGEVLKFVSPALNIPASDMAGFKLTMTNGTLQEEGYGHVTFELVTTEGTHTFSKDVTTTNATTYVFDFVGQDVTGTITGFSITPTQVDSAVIIDKMFFVPELSFNLTYDANTTDEVTELPAVEPILSNRHTVSVTGPKREGYRFVGWAARPDSIMPISVLTERKDTTLYAIWDKNTHWDFSSEDELGTLYKTSNIASPVYQNGTMYHDATTVNDPQMTMLNLKIDASSYKTVEYRLKKTTADTTVTWFPTTFYWTTSSSVEPDETKSVKENDLTKCNTELTTLTVDLSKNQEWKDTVESFRIDPIPYRGTYELDYVRFTENDSENLFVIGKGATEYLSNIPYSNIVLNGGTLVVDTSKTICNFAKAAGSVVHQNGTMTVTETAQFEGAMDNLPGYIKADESALVYLNDEIFVPREYDSYAALYGVKIFFEDFENSSVWQNTDKTVTATPDNGKVVVENNAKKYNNYNLFEGTSHPVTFTADKTYTMFIDVTDVVNDTELNGSDTLTMSYLRFALDGGVALSNKLTNLDTGNIDNLGTGTVKNFTVTSDVTNNHWYFGYINRAGKVTVDNFGLYYKPAASEAKVTATYNIDNNTASVTYPNGIYDETLYALTQNPTVIDGVVNAYVNGNTLTFELTPGRDVVIPSFINAACTATYEGLTLRLPEVDENALKYGIKMFVKENIGEMTFTAWQNRAVYSGYGTELEFVPGAKYTFVLDIASGDETKLQPTFNGGALSTLKVKDESDNIFEIPNGEKFVNGSVEFSVKYKYVPMDMATHNGKYNASSIQLCSSVAATYNFNSFGLYYKPQQNEAELVPVYDVENNRVTIVYPNGIHTDALFALTQNPQLIDGVVDAYVDGNTVTYEIAPKRDVVIPALVNALGSATYAGITLRIPEIDQNALKYGAKLFVKENIGQLSFTAWQNRAVYSGYGTELEFVPGAKYAFVLDTVSGDETKLQPTFNGTALTGIKVKDGSDTIFVVPNGEKFKNGSIEFTVKHKYVPMDTETHNKSAASSIQLCSSVAATYDFNSFGVYYKPASLDTVGDFVYNDNGTVSITYANGIDTAALNVILMAPYLIGAESAEYENNVLTLGTGENEIVIPELVNASNTATYPLFRVAPKTTDVVGIRVREPSGIRFMASLSLEQTSKAYEYGFIVAREATLTQYNSTLTHENSQKYGFAIAEGKSYSEDPQNPKAPVIFEQNEHEIFITAVLVGIPESAYNDKLTCRPYILAGGSYYYGQEISRSIKEIALKLVESGEADNLPEEQKAYIYKVAGLAE